MVIDEWPSASEIVSSGTPWTSRMLAAEWRN
jgi:hypothetical protein